MLTERQIEAIAEAFTFGMIEADTEELPELSWSKGSLEAQAYHLGRNLVRKSRNQ